MTQTPVATDIHTFDFWARPWAERNEAFRQLREEAPVKHYPPAESLLLPPELNTAGFWSVFRHEDIRRVSRDAKTSSSAQGVFMEDFPEVVRDGSLSFIVADAPRHTQLRGIVQVAFSPASRAQAGGRHPSHRIRARRRDGRRRRRRGVRAAVPAAAGTDLRELLRDPAGRAARRGHDLRRAHGRLVGPGRVRGARADRAVRQRGLPAQRDRGRDGRAAACDARGRPADLGRAGRVRGPVAGGLGDRLVLLAAGRGGQRHDAPHHLARVAGLPGAPRAEAAAARRSRGARRRRRRGGHPLRDAAHAHAAHGDAGHRDRGAGDRGGREGRAVVLRRQSRPGRLRAPGRVRHHAQPERHLGFGGGGPHFCLGSNLAKQTLRAALIEVYGRLPDIEVSDPEWLVANFVHGIKRLQGRWTPAA